MESAILCYLWLRDESVAQLVEHRPFKALVLGSSPSALTIYSIIYTGIIKVLLELHGLPESPGMP